MAVNIDFSRLKTSWTKYDIVHVIEVIDSIQTLDKFKNKEAIIDEPILRSFLGINSLSDPTPDYWVKIQNYPNEKKIFALLAALFTHGEIVKEFANKYSKENMQGGVFIVEEGKQYTNIRSALVVSGASQPIYRKKSEVPFDFSQVLQNGQIGKLFKQVLIERVHRLTRNELSDEEFYDVCYTNYFHKALGISKDQFHIWLEGNIISDTTNDGFIQKVDISNFFSIENVSLDFSNSKEIYFLGENGDGKSLILIGTYLAFNSNYITTKTDQEKTGKVTDIIRKNKDLQLTGIDNFQRVYSLHQSIHLNNLFGYGTHRGRVSTDNPEEYGCMSLFDSEQTLLNPMSWLKDQRLLQLEKDIPDNSSTGKTLPNFFPVDFLEKMFFDLLEKNVKVSIEGNEVLFKEKNADLTFDQLSEGYKSILIFVSDLIYRLNKNASPGEQIKDLKGVVLVDEIDLHLHPKWQRVLIGKLRKIFPNVQFIFTTHSPTIIQGASEDAIIYRVYRNLEDGKTNVTDPYYRKDLDHLMINTLLTSPLFGLNDSRMNPNDDNADTSDTYLLYRINKKLEEELEKQKAEGKEFIKDDQIDKLIQDIINEELDKNDKNK